jgi:two-component system cell cycle response regulator
MERGTILIVDDNPQILSIMSDLLGPLGYQIVCASGGREAIDQAAAAPPDLVLLDVMMPGMDGFEVCRRIRADAQLAQVPIILVTALDDGASRVQGFDAGADEFISKPFDYVELRARVATILRLNRYRQLLDEQARAAAERARFYWAVEQSDDGMLLLGPEARPRYANPRARGLLGLAPDAPLDEPFLALAGRTYALTPAEAWAGWPDQGSQESPRYLVRPASRAAPELWLRAELLPPSLSDDTHVLRLRDVTEQISTQREIWTFQAMIGHKLRTPLVSILGGLGLLSDGAQRMERESIARISDVALAGARRLHAEIEDLLHYLRPPADVSNIDRPTVAASALLATQIAVELGIEQLAVEHDPALAQRSLTISRRSLEVALRELLENAVKFHPQRKPAVAIGLERAGAAAVALTVRDDGLGLAPEQLALAWRPYYQGERSFTGQVDGMGLGLSLVARIVHAVGGSYGIANRGDGSGAMVTLTLPLAEPGADSAA